MLRHLRAESPPRSAVVTGLEGVGKSKLLSEASNEATGSGWRRVSIRGSAGLGGVPFGPFLLAFGVAGTDDPTVITRAVERELAPRASESGVLLVVDDGHHLDEASAGLLHQLVGSGLATAIVSSRTGSSPPDALVGLWRDGLASRIELEDLSVRETTELLAAGLEGPVQDSTAKRIWHVTGGNPLYVREVVLATAESGALTWEQGSWRWREDRDAGTLGPRLHELVTARIGRLDPEAQTALELVALAGPIPVQLVTTITANRAIEELEALDLVTVDGPIDRLEALVAHPLHAEVLRGAMPVLRRRAMWRNLVEALRVTGVHTDVDRVRLACWSLQAGLTPDAGAAALGSDAALYAIAWAIAGRLHEVMPDAVQPPPPGMPTVRQDHEVALRLATTAYAESGSIADGLALTSAMTWVGEVRKAEDLLAELSTRAADPDEQARLIHERAWIAFWARWDVDAAEGAIREVLDAEGCSTAVRAEFLQLHSGIALNTARPAEALALAESCAEVAGAPLASSPTATTAVAALSYLGRCGEAVALADSAVLAASEHDHPLTVATLLFAKSAALSRMGHLDDARSLAEWLRDVSLSNELVDAAAIFGVVLGEILLRQGHPASASRILLDSSGLLAERDRFGYHAWALGGLARARALTGEGAMARAALDEARARQPIPRNFEGSRVLAEVAVAEAEGDRAGAVSAAVEGAQRLRDAGLMIDEATVLLAWSGLALDRVVAERLEALASETDSEIVRLAAGHVRALLDGEAGALLDVARDHASIGAWWHAADAAAGASALLSHKGDDRAARAAAALAAEFADHCEGARIPRLASLGAPSVLTAREREIAALAVAGDTSKEIARKFFVSQRTVENHLHHAYVKLGVRNRTELAAALAASVRTGAEAPANDPF